MREAQGGNGQSAEFPNTPADRRRWWRVDCRDVANSHRFLDVLVNRDRVVLVGPPGHSAALSVNGLGQLSDALRDAAVQARK
ncbi:hypothetical protein [Saccharopolyspora spinosa]|uniref:Uncharacterized protein n=1 Tax=Saccharopolyspora spinosa TaxID=60894 RepID=A0A2N3XS81_SACSN|nr:hypothetical protein [Saccharopolyspora spinosa]PKW13525.1 hypothetical protein A8926_1061 [Saccharopolyspora spinosa]